MPQLVVNMKVAIYNKSSRDLKKIVSICGTHHIQTVRPRNNLHAYIYHSVAP